MFVNLKRYLNTADFRAGAKKKLPGPIFDYLDGGSDDEISLKNNRAAFSNYQILPRVLTDVSHIDMSTSIMGQNISFPVIFSPTGMNGLFHPEADLAPARAAQNLDTLYTLSTFSTVDLESVAKVNSGPKMFQVYVTTDHTLNDDIIDRCKANNYHALCLTVDTVIPGNRERDLYNGMTMPPKLTAKSIYEFVTHPRWVFGFIKGHKFQMGNLIKAHSMKKASKQDLKEYVANLLETKLTWKHAQYMIDRWDGPFAIKGIMSVSDAKQAVKIGASAIIISNHGGRQLDNTPAPIELVKDIREAVGPDIEIILDGGIRRGTDVLQAIALGANACSVGRNYLYGLAVAGQEGVEQAMGLLRDEIQRDMILSGCKNIKDINQDILRKNQR